jgi:hypothetical protein
MHVDGILLSSNEILLIFFRMLEILFFNYDR